MPLRIRRPSLRRLRPRQFGVTAEALGEPGESGLEPLDVRCGRALLRSEHRCGTGWPEQGSA